VNIDLSELSPNQTYHVLTQTIVPRPIGWVLSRNADRGLNLAPFSYFNAVGSSPAMVIISIGPRPDGTPKDTRRNIEARPDFVVHIAHGALVEMVNASSASMPPETSEVDALGLRTVELEGSPVPRLADARVALACRLHRIVEIGSAPQALLIAEVHHMYLADEVVARDDKGRLRIDAAGLDPLARLGASEYALLGEVRTLARPK